jgi:hypothetical protein
MLRNVYQRAMQDVGAAEYVHLVDLYGKGCTRLARLLKVGGCDEGEKILNYFHAMVDEAIRQVRKELLLDE